MSVTVWDRHASVDPYGAAVGRVGDGSRRWGDRADFRLTGEAEVARFVPTTRQFRRCLDVGCGPGRHLAALATRAGRVVGFDWCRAMRAEAATVAGSRPNIEIRGDDEDLGACGLFDLVWCRLVVQHQPCERSSLRLLDGIASRAAADGVIVLQVLHRRTVRWSGVRARIGALQWGLTRRGLPRLPMTALGESAFLGWCHRENLTVVSAVDDGGATGWLSKTYVLERTPNSG